MRDGIDAHFRYGRWANLRAGLDRPARRWPFVLPLLLLLLLFVVAALS